MLCHLQLLVNKDNMKIKVNEGLTKPSYTASPLIRCPDSENMGVIFPDLLAGTNKLIEPCENEILGPSNGTPGVDMIMASINNIQTDSQPQNPDNHILNIREPICQGMFTNEIKHFDRKY